MTCSVRVEESELIAFRDAQHADPVLMKLLELLEVELKCRNLGYPLKGFLSRWRTMDEDQWSHERCDRKSCKRTMMF